MSAEPPELTRTELRRVADEFKSARDAAERDTLRAIEDRNAALEALRNAEAALHKVQARLVALQRIDADIGVYPAAVTGYNDQRDYAERDAYKNGWNAAVMEYGAALRNEVSAAVDAGEIPELWTATQEVAFWRAFAARGENTLPDRHQAGGCICAWTRDGKWQLNPECGYHQLAARNPGDHRIPWNCPTFYDGCNCRETIASLRAAAAAADNDLADAVAWIRVVGDECVLAGMPGGDRTVILANIRRVLQALPRAGTTPEPNPYCDYPGRGM
jgi:hypothetical protein